MSIPTLYVFTISHFAEKARWALDHKRVSYRPVVLLPGPHRFTTRRHAGASQVPLLVHDGVAVAGSSAIIDHADRVWRERPLTPAGREAEVAELERALDDDIGENGRRVLYSYALDRPDVTIPLFTAGGPRWGSLFYRVGYRTIAGFIRSMYRVRDDEVARSKESFAEAIARLESRLRQGPYLLGDALSRVDITAAALLAPMYAPPEHPCKKWADVRAALPGWHAWASAFDGSPLADWVRRVYREHRAAA
jgi:glutathione S-transferase